jgi:hypothetical protein
MSLFKNENSSINVHVEKTQSFESFKSEVQEWEQRCKTKATGFTKHGSGMLKLSRHHDAQYDPRAFIEYGKKLGLRYFVGNSPDLDAQFEYEDDFIYVPSVYWIDRISIHPAEYDIDHLVKDAESRPTVVLMHPIWWAWKNDVRERFDQILDKAEFISLEKLFAESQ